MIGSAIHITTKLLAVADALRERKVLVSVESAIGRQRLRGTREITVHTAPLLPVQPRDTLKLHSISDSLTHPPLVLIHPHRGRGMRQKKEESASGMNTLLYRLPLSCITLGCVALVAVETDH